jgi:hypothetical protein
MMPYSPTALQGALVGTFSEVRRLGLLGSWILCVRLEAVPSRLTKLAAG